MYHDCFRLYVDKIHEQMQSNVLIHVTQAWLAYRMNRRAPPPGGAGGGGVCVLL
jgi:hypothetical protein